MIKILHSTLESSLDFEFEIFGLRKIMPGFLFKKHKFLKNRIVLAETSSNNCDALYINIEQLNNETYNTRIENIKVYPLKDLEFETDEFAFKFDNIYFRHLKELFLDDGQLGLFRFNRGAPVAKIIYPYYDEQQKTFTLMGLV